MEVRSFWRVCWVCWGGVDWERERERERVAR